MGADVAKVKAATVSPQIISLDSRASGV